MVGLEYGERVEFISWQPKWGSEPDLAWNGASIEQSIVLERRMALL